MRIYRKLIHRRFLGAEATVVLVLIAAPATVVAQIARADSPSANNSIPLPIGQSRLSLSSLQQPPDGWTGSPDAVLAAFGGPSLPSFSSPLPNPPAPPIKIPPTLRASPETGGVRPPPRDGDTSSQVNPSLPSRQRPTLPTTEDDAGSISIGDARLPEGALGARIEIGGGAYYHSYVPLQVENPLFAQVKANWAKLGASWSPRAFFLRRNLDGRWTSLQSRQTQLMSRAHELDNAWGGLRIEERAEEFRRGWGPSSEELNSWNTAALDYKGRCENRPPTQNCRQEYRHLIGELSRLQLRESLLLEEWGQAVEDVNAFYQTLSHYVDEVEIWQGELLEFNRRLQVEAGISSPASNQTNEILDQARQEAQRSGREVCDILDDWLRQANLEQDTARRMKIVQAQKFAGCRNRKKREEGQ